MGKVIKLNNSTGTTSGGFSPRNDACSKPADGKASAFGGCNRLAGQYRIIGKSLLQWESVSTVYSLARPMRVEAEFSTAVAFIPVEVLESYFDDLLNLEIPEPRLFIDSSGWGRRTGWLTMGLGGVVAALLSGLYVSSLGAPITVSFALAVALAIPFAGMLYAHAGAAPRRMRFAQILSREISKRRGTTGDEGGVFTEATLRLREFLAPHTQSAGLPLH